MGRLIQVGRIMPVLDRLAWPLSAVFMALGSYLLVDRILNSSWWPYTGTDLSVYLDAARAVSSGQNMYDPAHYVADVYGYPPFFAEVIALMRIVLGDGRGWVIWMALCAVALFASLAIMLRGFGKRTSWKWVVLLFSILFAGHITRTDLFHMQPHFFLLLLIVLGLRSFAANKQVAGGLAWATIFVCKPFTGVMIFWLMRRGEWRAVVATLSAATVLFLASFIPFLPNLVEGVRGWIAASGFHTGWPNVAKSGNETFYGLFHRLFGPETDYSSPWVELPVIIPFLAFPFLVIGALGIYFAATGRNETASVPSRERGAQDMVQIATVLGFSMSCGPLMEQTHCFLLLPGLVGSVMLAERRYRENAATKWRWIAAALAWSSTMFWLAFPIALPIINLYALGHITGPLLLVTMKMALFVLASCLLTVFALLGDRAARRASYSGTPAAAVRLRSVES